MIKRIFNELFKKNTSFDAEALNNFPLIHEYNIERKKEKTFAL
jgi:hypothetical protein